jgi:hypothetical protein
MTVTHEYAAEPAEREAYIRGLRELADWLEERPDVPLPELESDPSTPNLWNPTIEFEVYEKWSSDEDDRPQRMAAIARAMGGAEKGERYGGAQLALYRAFSGGVIYAAYTQRDAVCEKRVVGVKKERKRIVTDEEKADELRKQLRALEVVTEVEVEDVEYDCGSLLARG